MMNDVAKNLLMNKADEHKKSGEGYLREAHKLEKEAEGYRQRAAEHFEEAAALMSAVAEIQEPEEASRHSAQVDRLLRAAS